MTFFFKKKKLLSPSIPNPKLKQFSKRPNYETYYGFSRDPFDPQPDPRLFFLTENVSEVWNLILSGITQGERFLLLTGKRGTGKTTLISLIYLYLTTNSRKVKVIPLFDPSQKIEEIAQELLQGLGLAPKDEGESSMFSRLQWDLIQRSARGEAVVLIIDEAQNLRKETLEEIRFLAKPKSIIPNLVQEIFVADPQFEKDLWSEAPSLLSQRNAVPCRLRPFTLGESQAYIEHRLNKAGSTTYGVFTPRAVSLIIQASGGNPGTLNRICQEALLVGYSHLKKRLDPADVREALANLEREKERDWHPFRKTLPWIKRSLGKS